MRFLDGGGGSEGLMQSVDIADCMQFSLLEYARGVYGRDLTEGFPRLVEFDERFEKRESAKVEGGYSEDMLRKSVAWAEGST